MDVEDPKLTEFTYSLKNDTSAFIVVAQEPVFLDLVAAFEPFDAEIIETGLSEEDVEELRNKLRKG